MKTVFFCHFKRTFICTVKQFWFASATAVPDRTYCMNNMFSRKIKSGSNNRITGLTAADLITRSL